MGKELRLKELEELQEEERIYRLCKFYGIPYLVFDNGSVTQKDLDRKEAFNLISCGKPIPQELKSVLLKYKKDEENGVPYEGNILSICSEIDDADSVEINELLNKRDISE